MRESYKLILAQNERTGCVMEEAEKNLGGVTVDSLESHEHSSLVGRELDAAIAERVMGWTLTRRGGEGKYRDSMYWRGAPIDMGGQVDWHWNPSENITRAMEVVERLRDLDGRTQIETCNKPEGKWWVVVLMAGPTRFAHEFAYAETLPLAICRAALAAMRNNAPERDAETDQAKP